MNIPQPLASLAGFVLFLPLTLVPECRLAPDRDRQVADGRVEHEHEASQHEDEYPEGRPEKDQRSHEHGEGGSR